MYCITLFSYTNKYPLLANNCPVLIIMLIALTIFTVVNEVGYNCSGIGKVSSCRES